jgi:release factor glutamine methyltransferase
MDIWTIRRVLEWTASDLSKRGVASARLDAEVLLAHALGTDRLGLFLDIDRPLDPDERAVYRRLVETRRQRVPVAHITGEREFWSLPIVVDPHVLVPRPDTEVVVEEALAVVPAGSPQVAVDVGTGSGCIALAVASERPDLRVLALDIDRRAALVAAGNAKALGLDSRVAVAVGDLLAPVAGPVGLVVANLPYIPSGRIDGLEPEVSRWEPRLALDGGQDGLAVFRRLVPQAADVVVPGGWLVLEVADAEQARQVEAMLDPAFELVRVRRDYGHEARAVVARRVVP